MQYTSNDLDFITYAWHIVSRDLTYVHAGINSHNLEEHLQKDSELTNKLMRSYKAYVKKREKAYAKAMETYGIFHFGRYAGKALMR